MSILLLVPDRDMSPLRDAILRLDPDIDVEIWPGVSNKQRIQFVVSWNHPAGILGEFPNLRVVSSLGAGVDHIFRDQDLPGHVSVTRVVTHSLVRQMKEYILNAVLTYQRNIDRYFRQKQSAEWKVYPNKKAEDIPVGIMGLGTIGTPVAAFLSQNGYHVNGWARSEKEISNVTTFTEDQLGKFLRKTRILICLLPLTPDTRGILDLELLKQLKRPAYLVNTGRGEHLVEEDLVYALDKGWLDGAFLDVFAEEPLPDQHPFWNRENIMITPHVSSLTPPEEAARQIVDNYKRALSGLELVNKADRERGY